MSERRNLSKVKIKQNQTAGEWNVFEKPWLCLIFGRLLHSICIVISIDAVAHFNGNRTCSKASKRLQTALPVKKRWLDRVRGPEWKWDEDWERVIEIEDKWPWTEKWLSPLSLFLSLVQSKFKSCHEVMHHTEVVNIWQIFTVIVCNIQFRNALPLHKHSQIHRC